MILHWLWRILCLFIIIVMYPFVIWRDIHESPKDWLQIIFWLVFEIDWIFITIDKW